MFSGFVRQFRQDKNKPSPCSILHVFPGLVFSLILVVVLIFLDVYFGEWKHTEKWIEEYNEFSPSHHAVSAVTDSRLILSSFILLCNPPLLF